MTSNSRSACQRNPFGYANRPLEQDFDPYAALRIMLAKLTAAVKDAK